MQIAITEPLFAWDCLEDSPSLATVKAFLASVPDARLLEMLRHYRGSSCNLAGTQPLPAETGSPRFFKIDW